jgi:hypothetical protein
MGLVFLRRNSFRDAMVARVHLTFLHAPRTANNARRSAAFMPLQREMENRF